MLSVLKKHSEFVSVAEKGHKFATTGLVLQKLVRPDGNNFGDTIRVGFTTTKKIGNAVVRVRTRRRLRAIAREILPLYAEKSCDYVLIGRSATASRDFASLINDLQYALRNV